MTPGAFSAVVAHFNVSLKGNVLLPGCFRDGKLVLLSRFGHSIDRGEKPVGMARIFSEGDAIVARGSFDLQSLGGLVGFHWLERMGRSAQWSCCWQTLDRDHSRSCPFDPRQTGLIELVRTAYFSEISPVLRGADPNTHTISCGSYQRLSGLSAA